MTFTPVPKPKRKQKREKKNKALRRTFHTKNCVIVSCGRYGSDPCHIRSWGATGKDTPEGMIPMCRRHHKEQGDLNWLRFSEKYPEIGKILKERGYRFNSWGKLLSFQTTPRGEL